MIFNPLRNEQEVERGLPIALPALARPEVGTRVHVFLLFAACQLIAQVADKHSSSSRRAAERDGFVRVNGRIR